jgi:hypothetical protein
VTDRVDMFVCDGEYDTASAFVLSEKRTTKIAVDGALSAVWAGRVFRVDGPHGPYTVDMAGTTIDAELPGETLTVTDDYLIVRGAGSSSNGYRLS